MNRWTQRAPLYLICTLILVAIPALGQTQKPAVDPEAVSKPRVQAVPRVQLPAPDLQVRIRQAEIAEPKLSALGRLPAVNPKAPSPDHLTLVGFGENLEGSEISGALAHLPDPCDYRCKGLWDVFRRQLDQAEWQPVSDDRFIAVVAPALTQVKLTPHRTRPNEAPEPRERERPAVRVVGPDSGYLQSDRGRWEEEGFLVQPISLKFHPKGSKSTLWTAEEIIQVEIDEDRDGVEAIWAGGADCDDKDPNRFPGNPEIPDTQGHDEDCDLNTIGDLDRDGDGYVDHRIFNEGGARGRDCNDQRENINPGVAESTNNGVDDDCDGEVDESG